MARSRVFMALFIIIAVILWTLAFVVGLWRFVASPVYGTIVTGDQDAPQKIDDKVILGAGQAGLIMWSISGIFILGLFYVLSRRPKAPFIAVYITGCLCAACLVLQLIIGGCDLALAALGVGKISTFEFDCCISCCQLMFFFAVFLQHFYKEQQPKPEPASETEMDLLEETEQ